MSQPVASSYQQPSNLPAVNQRGQEGFHISSQQIAARQVLRGNLPSFDGNPEEWPLFISSYESSASACGFSNAENQSRLLSSLRGKARKAVRSLLMLPETVPEAIDMLRLMFGSPKFVMHSLLMEIRDCPPPKYDKFDTVIEFALSVKNLCATAQASGLSDQVRNPTLLQELIDKLPTQIKVNWAMYSVALEHIDILVFGDWLFKLAIALNKTVLPNSSDSRNRKHSHEKSYLNSHEETLPVSKESSSRQQSSSTNSKTSRESTSKQQQTNSSNRSQSFQEKIRASQQCAICNSSAHPNSECTVFKNMSNIERWNKVREHRLCGKCLHAHNYKFCKASKKCGVNSCEAKHHPLLHRKISSINTQTIEAGCNTHRQINHSVIFRVILHIKIHKYINSL